MGTHQESQHPLLVHLLRAVLYSALSRQFNMETQRKGQRKQQNNSERGGTCRRLTTKQKSGCKFMQVTQKVTVSQIPRRPLKMQETFSPPSFLGEVLLLSLLDSTHFPCFIIKERFFCVFCICVSSSPLGFQRPRCKTSAAASCTFSQPWKRPRWLRVPTALGKAWWTSWNNILKWQKKTNTFFKKRSKTNKQNNSMKKSILCI